MPVAPPQAAERAKVGAMMSGAVCLRAGLTPRVPAAAVVGATRQSGDADYADRFCDWATMLNSFQSWAEFRLAGKAACNFAPRRRSMAIFRALSSRGSEGT